MTLPSNDALVDVLISTTQSANCREFPFDIQDDTNGQSLLVDYGQASCPVYMNNKAYHGWTGVWNQSQFVYLNLTKSLDAVAFSLNMTGK